MSWEDRSCRRLGRKQFRANVALSLPGGVSPSRVPDREISSRRRRPSCSARANGDRFRVRLSDYPYAEADEVATRRTGSSLRRLSWAIHASASASDSKPSIVWRVPSLPAMLMLKPLPSPLGAIEYVVMCSIWVTRIRIASRTRLAHQIVKRWMGFGPVEAERNRGYRRSSGGHAADGFDVVAVRIEDEGTVVIGVVLGAKTWWAIVLATSLERGGVEGVDHGSVWRGEGDVGAGLGRVFEADPEVGFTVGAVAGECSGLGVQAADAEGAERLIVEGLGAFYVGYADGDVIQHVWPRNDLR
jgi:hypothetical protein